MRLSEISRQLTKYHFEIMDNSLPEENFKKLNLIIFERMNLALAQLGFRNQLLSVSFKDFDETGYTGEELSMGYVFKESCR